jgi:penicillin-binding protein 2
LRTSDSDPISVGIFHKQLRNATLLVLALFSILVLRLWFLQIVNGPAYRARSEHNRIRLHDIPPFRGMIMDRKGNVLVDNRPSYDLNIIPEDIQDRDRLLESLRQLIGLDPEIVEQKLKEASSRHPFKPLRLEKDISRDQLAIIETHLFNLPGVTIKVEPQRHYVYGKLAFHLLGYLGQIGENQMKSGQYPNNKLGDLIGKSGVEARWQSSLSGTRGGEQIEVDAAGRKIRTISMKPPIRGTGICLTIDKDLQITAEKALTGKKGAIAALDPNTGEVLALASSPAVDPNLFIGGIDQKTWQEISTSRDFPLQNRTLTGQYPPASVFKIVVALAGLEEGTIDPEEIIRCNGYFFLGRHRYNCWKRHGHGNMDLHSALVQSCDVYFYQMGKELGVDTIARYSKKLGLGKSTGFEAGQEKGGLIPTSEWKLRRTGVRWQGGETISMSIGQSFLLVTPIQAAVMISSVFNGGILYKTQVTKSVAETEFNKTYEFTPRVAGKINIRQEHIEIVKKALTGVVNEPHGTGSRTRFKDITVAGKTGTAQVVALKKDQGQSIIKDDIPVEHRDHAWFVAIAPVENPRIAIAKLIEHGGHGGSAAAPIAREMIDVYLRGNDSGSGSESTEN